MTKYSNKCIIFLVALTFLILPINTKADSVYTKVIPGGNPIGVRLQTDGVLVIGFSDIETSKGYTISPSAEAGIELGDRILEINNIKIKSSNELTKYINKNGNKEITIKLKRNSETKIYHVKPVQTDKDNIFKIGLWIRDSTAGIGTLTFYEPKSKMFGALGHPINDIDTGTLLRIKYGNIFNANIVSVEQSLKGRPGELRGSFSEEDVCGKLIKNTESGIYGSMEDNIHKGIYDSPIPIALQSEIKEGPAKILTCLNGTEVKDYEIYIEKLTKQTKPDSKSMIIKVIDKRLLNKTGGIVQGMSGSPIIQDGKLVGAVTHVFINKPDMGYGIYIEWMIKESQFAS